MEPSEKRTRLYIGGMVCVNCQTKIEHELRRTKGIVSADVSYSQGTADIVYRGNEISLKEIAAVIERADYTVLSRRGQQRTDLTRTVCMLVIIVAFYVMLQSMGVLNLLAPGQLADSKTGYGMLFVIGLLTSVHCIAMCGGINLSQCLPRPEQEEPEGGRLAVLRPALAYNLGRVASYTAIGFVLGLAGFLIGGTGFGISALLQGTIKIIAGLFMVVMGLNMLQIFPWLHRLSPRMPKALAQKIGRARAGSSRAFIVGVLNGFMPCGPLQSMWLVSAATCNPFAGALSMLLFSLGTVPLMLGLGSAVSALGKKFTGQVMTAGSVLVVILGLAMLSQGGSLSGWLPPDLLLVLILALCAAGVLLSLPVQKRLWKNALKAAALAVVAVSYGFWSFQGALLQNGAEADDGAALVDGVQVVSSVLEPGHYPNITVQAGIPVKWVIDAPEGSINGCNQTLLIRDYDIEYTFHTGENVIEFTPSQSGTIRYSCWMGMIHGNIFVTDGAEDSAEGGTAAAGGDILVPTPAGYVIPTEQLAVASLSEDEYGNAFQELSIALTDEGFSPAVIVVQKNLTVAWNIDVSMTGAESGLELLAPYYSISLPLSAGSNPLGLYPTESFAVSTGDNRFYCYVKVVDDLSAVDEEAVKEEAAAFETLIYPPEIFQSAGMSCCA